MSSDGPTKPMTSLALLQAISATDPAAGKTYPQMAMEVWPALAWCGFWGLLGLAHPNLPVRYGFLALALTMPLSYLGFVVLHYRQGNGLLSSMVERLLMGEHTVVLVLAATPYLIGLAVRQGARRLARKRPREPNAEA